VQLDAVRDDVETTKDFVAAAGISVAAEERLEAFEAGFACIAGRFGQVEPRRQARAFLLGLLSDVDTRSCWQLAEQAGDRTPHRMQRLLGRAVWDADAWSGPCWTGPPAAGAASPSPPPEPARYAST